jgi:CubicO group peptidase (beta-lactamase class C family)
MVGDLRLEPAVRDAVGRPGRRPGLLVAGATDGTDKAVAAAGPVPQPQYPPERVVFEIGSVTKVFTALLLAIAVERSEAGLDDPGRLAYWWRPWIHAATVTASGDQSDPAAPPSSSQPWPAPSASTTSRLARTGAAS